MLGEKPIRGAVKAQKKWKRIQTFFDGASKGGKRASCGWVLFGTDDAGDGVHDDDAPEKSTIVNACKKPRWTVLASGGYELPDGGSAVDAEMCGLEQAVKATICVAAGQQLRWTDDGKIY